MSGSSPAVPHVSVVIPTYRRETRLAFALEGLAEQTLAVKHFEVLVVRAPGGLSVPLGDAPAGLDVRFLVAETAGAAAQRNAGWREARAPLVAFLDDDCRPHSDWLERLLGSAEGVDGFVQGRTEPDPDENHLLHGLARTMVVTEPSPWYPTCNIAYQRSLLERLGGFDERFPGAYGEDTDLALRALDAGAEAEFNHNALVWHAVHARTLRQALREARRRDVMPLVIKRHPRAREGLYRGLFFTWRHPYTWLALVGIMLCWRSRLAVVTALPYLYVNVDRGYLTPRGIAVQAAHMPAQMLVDVTEVLVVLRAAIRNRVLVL